MLKEIQIENSENEVSQPNLGHIYYLRDCVEDSEPYRSAEA